MRFLTIAVLTMAFMLPAFTGYASDSKESVAKQLVGTWSLELKGKNLTYYREDVFNEDGTGSYTFIVGRGNDCNLVQGELRWEYRYDLLTIVLTTMTILQEDRPQKDLVGKTARMGVSSLSESSFTGMPEHAPKPIFFKRVKNSKFADIHKQ